MTEHVDKVVEIKCPHCSEKIDLEVLMNIFSQKRR